MSRLRLTPAARSDLNAIWTCTAKHWDIDQAETYVRSLASSMQLLASSPGLGRRIDDIRPGHLKFAVASQVIFYREARDGIRILHKRMDVERHL
jgi:toxin ParE1/3/4